MRGCKLIWRQPEVVRTGGAYTPDAVAPLDDVEVDFELSFLGERVAQLIRKQVLPRLAPWCTLRAEEEVASQLLCEAASASGEVSAEDTSEHLTLDVVVEGSDVEELAILGQYDRACRDGCNRTQRYPVPIVRTVSGPRGPIHVACRAGILGNERRDARLVAFPGPGEIRDYEEDDQDQERGHDKADASPDSPRTHFIVRHAAVGPVRHIGVRVQ